MDSSALISSATNTILQISGGIAAITLAYIFLSIWLNIRKEKRLETIEHDVRSIRENTLFIMTKMTEDRRENK